jgi:hypothetical protein
MLSLFPVACSNFGASSLKAEVSATDVYTLISAALLATAANKHDINPPAAISAMRFANDVWIMYPSLEINFSYSITSSARSTNGVGNFDAGRQIFSVRGPDSYSFHIYRDGREGPYVALGDHISSCRLVFFEAIAG